MADTIYNNGSAMAMEAAALCNAPRPNKTTIADSSPLVLDGSGEGRSNGVSRAYRVPTPSLE